MDTATFTCSDRRAADLVVALADDGFEVGTAKPVTRTWLDTFDGRLHAGGLRLEMRAASGLELILAGPGIVPAHVTVNEPPRRASDLLAGPFRARVAPIIDVRALLPVVTVTARRTAAIRRDGSGKAVVTVAVHEELDVAAGSGLVGWTIEVDELAGYPKPAARARDLLDRVGLRRLDGDTLDAAAVAVGADPAGYRASPTIPLDRDAPALDGYRAVLANLTDAVDANWQGTVEDIDPEFLHDLRVAVRRIRSVLAQGKGVLSADARQRFRDGYGRLGEVTGRARDLDVYVTEWDRYVAPLPADIGAALDPVLAHLEISRTTEHASLAAALGRERPHLLAEWRAWLAAPGPPGVEAGRALGEVIAERIATAQRRMLTHGRSIGPDAPAEDLHALRKDAKKLRYLLECFGGLLDAAPRKAFLQRLKTLQDNLGDHQDAEVQAHQLRATSRTLHDSGATSDTLLAIGQLTEHVEQRRRAARGAFAKLFAAYDTKRVRRALDDLLRALP